MDKKFLLKLALRNLVSHRLRTILTLVGIVIGVSAVVFLISFGYGIQRLVTQQITGGDAFQLIDIGTGNSQVIRLDKDAISKIKELQNISSVETVTNLAGKAKKDDNTMDVGLFATSPIYIEWAGKKIRFGENLPPNTTSEKKVVVNTAYVSFITKDKPEKAIGSKVKFDIIIPKELSNSGDPKTIEGQEFTISGIIKDDATPSVYINFDSIPESEIKSFSQAKARVTNQNKVVGARKQIEAFGLKTQYVGDTVAEVEQVFTIFKVVLGSFGFIALLVALLGMFNTLTISLLERVKEVALMKILGMNRKDIRNLFIAEALALGLFGGVAGILWGIILGKLANIILNYFAVRAGSDPVTIFYYPVILISSIVVAAALVGLITGVYPAKRAAKINPLDVLRYE